MMEIHDSHTATHHFTYVHLPACNKRISRKRGLVVLAQGNFDNMLDLLQFSDKTDILIFTVIFVVCNFVHQVEECMSLCFTSTKSPQTKTEQNVFFSLYM